MVVVEKGVLHSAESSALAASRAFFLLMPTSALQAVSFRSAPSARMERPVELGSLEYRNLGRDAPGLEGIVRAAAAADKLILAVFAEWPG